MNPTQAIEHPYGISVFGSAIMRVEPDVVSLNFSVSRLAQQPRDAFREARDGAQSVQSYLTQAKIMDVGSSRVTLAQKFEHKSGEARFIGYQATVNFYM